MLLGWLTSNLVIHQSCHEVLKSCLELINDCLICSFISLLFKYRVHLDDLLVGICQVVLTSHSAGHSNRGSYTWWSDCNISEYGPLRSPIDRVQAHYLSIFIADPQGMLAGISVFSILS